MPPVVQVKLLNTRESKLFSVTSNRIEIEKNKNKSHKACVISKANLHTINLVIVSVVSDSG